MKRLYRVIFLLLLLLPVFGMRGETVSQKKAKEMAAQFFNAAHGRMMSEPKLVYNGKRLTTDRLFTPFYVYNLPTGGWVMISADNKAFPILAFDLKENFDPSAMSKPQQALLSGYAHDIEMIRYDSRIPEQAIAAWQDYPHYVDALLKQRYSARDVEMSTDEVRSNVMGVIRSSREDLFSDLFTTEQWLTMIDEELASGAVVSLGVITPSIEVESMAVHGRQGDYYRIRFDAMPNNALYRLFATEFLSDGQLALLSSPLPLPLAEPERDFAYLDSFYAGDDDSTRSLVSQPGGAMLQEPKLEMLGGGRYMITIPGEARLANVYNLAGALVKQTQYSGQPYVSVDLMGHPDGFYFIQVIDSEGHPYGFKLLR